MVREEKDPFPIAFYLACNREDIHSMGNGGGQKMNYYKWDIPRFGPSWENMGTSRVLIN